MKIFSIILSFLLLIGCENKDNKVKGSDSEKTINVAVSSDYPPFVYGESGKLVGFEFLPSFSLLAFVSASGDGATGFDLTGPEGTFVTGA